MPRISVERRATRREEILEAARRCFARNGLHATTTDDICREAGLSAGAVYTYFESKQAIIQAFVKAECDAAMAQLSHLSAVDVPLTQLLPTLARVWGANPRTQEDVRAAVHMFAEAGRDPGIAAMLRDADREPREALAGAIRAGQLKGEVNSGVDPEAVARIVMAVAQGLLVQQAREEFDIAPVVVAAETLLGGRLLTHGADGSRRQ